MKNLLVKHSMQCKVSGRRGEDSSIKKWAELFFLQESVKQKRNLGQQGSVLSAANLAEEGTDYYC
jgi:hypothetical protein